MTPLKLDPGIWAAIIGLSGLALGYIINALVQLWKLRKEAPTAEASATAVVVAAARELVDPLRAELAQERKDHAEGVAVERRKVAEVRLELDAVREELVEVRADLAKTREDFREMHNELSRVREENIAYRERIAELEAENAA